MGIIRGLPGHGGGGVVHIFLFKNLILPDGMYFTVVQIVQSPIIVILRFSTAIPTSIFTLKTSNIFLIIIVLVLSLFIFNDLRSFCYFTEIDKLMITS